MEKIYIHLSDIHFGQERGGALVVNNDVKEQLLQDVRKFIFTVPNGKADGVIVSGDIAFAGKPSEYQTAGQWLDRLTAVSGCDKTSVQLVPGNHDIDRESITHIVQSIIDEIIAGGDTALDKYLESESDREVLYRRFAAYRSFAEAYDCPLDADGGILNHRTVEISAGKFLKFYGVNTALICSNSKKEKGGLLLGARQRVIGTPDSTETIVIAHHPLSWLQDSDEAMTYIRNRARVFVSGHEHQPTHEIVMVDQTKNLLMLASGAAIPPSANEIYNYCYNVLIFNYEDKSNELIVTIHGRTWNHATKTFESDNTHFTDGIQAYRLQCPNFVDKAGTQSTLCQKEITTITSNAVISETSERNGVESYIMSDKQNQLVLLNFFRNLTAVQRLTILIELGSIPDGFSEPLTHTIERRALDNLLEQGKSNFVTDAINKVLLPKISE